MMAQSLKLTIGIVVLLHACGGKAAILAPAQDIVLPPSSSASNPLEWLGANSPWFAGPDVNGVDNSVPDDCTVEQAAYVSRHGSRYPDTGAYAQWTALYDKIQAAGEFESKGDLAFLKNWKPVLKNPAAEIAQESITGYKEAYDLGYTLRVRYPDFYAYGSPFMVWANLYPRVVQTAQNFVRGFLGTTATTLGMVISVDSKASSAVLGNSLSPSDLCPAFVDGNGGTPATIWDSIYLPPITKRLNKLIKGNLTFLDSDTTIFPYLCGFESQITGSLSPWCSTFTNAELKQYEYRQDLRYYYGTGPGVSLASTMMLPFLKSLVGLLQEGPGVQGKFSNGSAYTLNNLIVAFANDGQLNELATATGVFDDQPVMLGTKIPSVWKYISSRFVSMRGTVAFERLSFSTTKGTSKAGNSTNGTYVRILLNDAVYPLPSCNDGPGKSCALVKYVQYVSEKYSKTGNWAKNCNVTGATNATVVKGASFFTSLSLDGLAMVVP